MATLRLLQLSTHRRHRVDRQRLGNRSGKRSVMVVLRQRGGQTLAKTLLRGAQDVDLACKKIARGSIVSADESRHWDLLDFYFNMQRINHSTHTTATALIPISPKAISRGCVA